MLQSEWKLHMNENYEVTNIFRSLSSVCVTIEKIKNKRRQKL